MKEKWIYLNSPQYPFEIDEWYENGNRKFSGFFKKSWTFYNMNGKIEREEFYINGKLIQVKGKKRVKNK